MPNPKNPIPSRKFLFSRAVCTHHHHMRNEEEKTFRSRCALGMGKEEMLTRQFFIFLFLALWEKSFRLFSLLRLACRSILGKKNSIVVHPFSLPPRGRRGEAPGEASSSSYSFLIIISCSRPESSFFVLFGIIACFVFLIFEKKNTKNKKTETLMRKKKKRESRTRWLRRKKSREKAVTQRQE